MAKPITIAVTGNKGGIGKTATTICLADAIRQQLPDAKILLVDGDDQSCLKTTFQVRLRDAEGGLAAVLLDAVEPNEVTIEVRDRLSVILSGGKALRDLEKNLPKSLDADKLLKTRFETIKGYDFVIFDTPPAINHFVSNVATYVDYIITPCSPDLYGYMGVKNTISFLNELEKHFEPKGLTVARLLGILPTMFDGRRSVDLETLDSLEGLVEKNETRGAIIYDPIRNDIKVKSSAVKRKLLSEFAPHSKATEDYNKLATIILEQIGYFNRKTKSFDETSYSSALTRTPADLVAN
jgi:chromosome partitioning protein